jgi:iron(III) transport system substrate-binding protein
VPSTPSPSRYPSGRGIARRWGPVTAIAAAACSLLAACGSSGGGSDNAASPAGTAVPAAEQTSITLYSGQHPQTTQNLVKAFEKQTGITVKVRSDDEDPLADQMITEGSRSPADVFFTENTPPLEALHDHGLLSKVNASTLALEPAKYASPTGDWAGVSARVSVIVYNPKLIAAKDLPTTLRQFGDPKYRGKLALAPEETDFQPIVTSALKYFGQAGVQSWLKAIKANAAGGHIYPDNETVVDKVNQGQVAFGLINQYYFYRLKAEIGAGNVHAQIQHFAPGDAGYVIDVSGVGILRSSKEQAADQKFVAFLLSKQGQEIIGNPAESISYEYPIASGVVSQAPETPLADLRPNNETLDDLGNGSVAIDLMRQAGLL